MVLLLLTGLLPLKAIAEVQQIQELEEKLEGISEEEKTVLEKLFSIKQEIDGLRIEEEVLQADITTLNEDMRDLENQITGQKEAYDLQLLVLKKVLVNYQRGGATSYLEILLMANNLSDFLKSLNIMKDISHNVNDLLTLLKDNKLKLEQKQKLLVKKSSELKEKQEALLSTIESKQALQEEQEDYLATLLNERDYYQEQLAQVVLLWTDNQTLFANLMKDLNDIIAAGYFTEEDLNLNIGFFNISGYLQEETFNQIILDNSTLAPVKFLFEEEQVVIEVVDKHLVLKGHFIVDGEKAIEYQVDEARFFDLPLEPETIKELFQNGPIIFDFEGIAKDMIQMDFRIEDVWSEEGTLNFIIYPQF
jgi:peptidoglycan hydrolase CwlO-like protein